MKSGFRVGLRKRVTILVRAMVLLCLYYVGHSVGLWVMGHGSWVMGYGSWVRVLFFTAVPEEATTLGLRSYFNLRSRTL